VEPVVSIGHDKNIELDKERIKNGFENKMKAMTDFGKVRLDFLN
jgi:hypothetical protein